MHTVAYWSVVDSGIIPTVHKLVQVFKIPPENRTNRKQRQEKPWFVQERAVAGLPETQGIRNKDV